LAAWLFLAAAFCDELEDANAGEAPISSPTANKKIPMILKTNVTFPCLNPLPLNRISIVYNRLRKNFSNQSIGLNVRELAVDLH
jgi:hypothetical protein